MGCFPEPLKPAAGSVLFASLRGPRGRLPPVPSSTDGAPEGRPRRRAYLLCGRGMLRPGKPSSNRRAPRATESAAKGHRLGPDLSQVGSKLAKESLFAKILQPNGGVDFGFEGYTFRLRNGETVAGYIESETAQQLSVRSMGGITTRYDKQQVVSREPLPGSLMPTGLATSMTEKQLVDFVAYLASRKGLTQSPRLARLSHEEEA